MIARQMTLGDPSGQNTVCTFDTPAPAEQAVFWSHPLGSAIVINGRGLDEEFATIRITCRVCGYAWIVERSLARRMGYR